MPYLILICLIAATNTMLSAQTQDVFTVKDDKVVKETKKPVAKSITKSIAKPKAHKTTATTTPKATKPAHVVAEVKKEPKLVPAPAPIATKPKELIVAKADTSITEVIQYAYIAEGKAISTSATRKSGPYYKVQFASVKEMKQATSMMEIAKVFGRIDTEYLFDNKLTRLLIGDYTDALKAKVAATQLKAKGFKEAFVVVYQDGMRQKSYALK